MGDIAFANRVSAKFQSHSLSTERREFPTLDANARLTGGSLERWRLTCDCGWRSEFDPDGISTLKSDLALQMNRAAAELATSRMHAPAATRAQLTPSDGREFWRDTKDQAFKKWKRHARTAPEIDIDKLRHQIANAEEDALVAADAFMENGHLIQMEVNGQVDVEDLKVLAVCKYRLEHDTISRWLFDPISRKTRRYDVYCLFCREMLAMDVSKNGELGAQTDFHTIRCGLLYLGGRSEHTSEPSVRKLPPDLFNREDD